MVPNRLPENQSLGVPHVLRERYPLWPEHKKIVTDLLNCRTAELGGRLEQCDACGVLRIIYHSCRNRHCPKCQGHKREQWINKRESELIKTPYYHVVFTLPDDLNGFSLFMPSQMYALLFKTAWSVIKDFAENPDLVYK